MNEIGERSLSARRELRNLAGAWLAAPAGVTPIAIFATGVRALDHVCVAVFRRGRGTSSPPQFGQRRFISLAQRGQKVHSKEQMKASPSAERRSSHRSHSARISSAIVLPAFSVPSKLTRFDRAQILTLVGVS